MQIAGSQDIKALEQLFPKKFRVLFLPFSFLKKSLCSLAQRTRT